MKISPSVLPQSTTFHQAIIAFFARYPNELFKTKELARRLGIKDDAAYQQFKEDLRVLQDEGKILRVHGKQFGHLHKPEIVTGTLYITKHKTGMVKTADGADIFIPAELLDKVYDGDDVEVGLRPQGTKQKDKGGRRQAESIRTLKHQTQTVVGTVQRIRKLYIVVPDNKKTSPEVAIEKDRLNGASEDSKVVVEVTRPAGRTHGAEGIIIEVLGKSGELSAEILSVARQFNLPLSFPREITSAADALPAEIPEQEIARRLDLRHILCFTIDPEDAKDFDDAVSLEVLTDGNYKLGVHIADVSYFVKENGLLDQEALSRGTSVYFPNGVIPMLPERLSNDLCSLRPNVDRLAFSVLMTMTPRGAVKDYEIRESIINSKRRFSYEDVQTVIEQIKNNSPAAAFDDPILHTIKLMYELTTVLTKKRLHEGSIDFETSEAKFQFDQQGKPTAIIKKVRLESNRLVEEFMLLANQVVARHIGFAKKEEHPKPFIYRVHDTPDPERIRELAVFVRKLGFKLSTDSGVTSKALQRLLDEVKGSEVENVINKIVLRCMAKAIYSERNIGHYGLAFDYYAHFTSPIRRYPDLIVHRMLKQYNRNISLSEREHLRKHLPYIAKQSSERERAAMEAERAAVKIVQVEFMKRHLGDEFKAVISGVAQYGLFIEINDILVEGMVHVREMEDDYYQYDEKQYALIGKRSGTRYRLGDPVLVKVVKVNPEDGQIDFILVRHQEQR